MKFISRGAVALLTGIVVLASASLAQAIIQVQHGISGIRLNMSPAQVRAGLGKPEAVTHGKNDFGKFTQYKYRGGILVSFQGNHNVTAVSISSRSDRTASGVGVGSTKQQVKNGVHGVKCGAHDCHVGSLRAGHRVTDFLFHNGHVKRVTIGFVID